MIQNTRAHKGATTAVRGATQRQRLVMEWKTQNQDRTCRMSFSRANIHIHSNTALTSCEIIWYSNRFMILIHVLFGFHASRCVHCFCADIRFLNRNQNNTSYVCQTTHAGNSTIRHSVEAIRELAPSDSYRTTEDARCMRSLDLIIQYESPRNRMQIAEAIKLWTRNKSQQSACCIFAATEGMPLFNVR